MFSLFHGIANSADALRGSAKEGFAKFQSLQRQYVLSESAPLSADVLKKINTPRVIDLITTEIPDNAPINFYVFGCAGDGRENQKRVAKMLNDIAESHVPPRFCIMLGDNFYDNGVSSEHDNDFNEKFHEVYHTETLAYMADLPYFVVLGNHDHNLHRNFSLNPGNIHGNIKPHKIAAQVMHTFLKDSHHCYESNEIPLLSLPRWNMPSHFYMVQWQNIEMYFIDSNTYVKDFLTMDKGHGDNQAAWLLRTAQNPDKTKLIFCHHPMLTVGKRAYDFDTSVYLSPQDEAVLKEVYGVEGGYNTILRHIIFTIQKLSFDAVFSAHDHVMSYHLDRNQDQTQLCQIVAGGGGGDLQDRQCPKDWKNMPFFASDHGFVNVTIMPNDPQKKIQLDFHFGLASYRHVRFDNLSVTPFRQSVETNPSAECENQLIETIRNVFLLSYEEYLELALKRSNGDGGLLRPGEYHGSKGINNADKIRNLLNNYTQVDVGELIKLIVTTFRARRTYPTPTSLSSLFENNMLALTGQSFESLVENYEARTLAQQEADDTTPVVPRLSDSPYSLFRYDESSPGLLSLSKPESPHLRPPNH